MLLCIGKPNIRSIEIERQARIICRREEEEKKTTHRNVDYSRYTNLISNSIHQTLQFFVWILCLEFFRFFPISVFHWFFTDARSKSHSFSLSAGREKNEFSCIYIWFFCYAHRLSPSIHHLKALVCGMENRLTTIQSMIIIIPNLSSGSQRIFLSVFFFFGSVLFLFVCCTVWNVAPKW